MVVVPVVVVIVDAPVVDSVVLVIFIVLFDGRKPFLYVSMLCGPCCCYSCDI